MRMVIGRVIMCAEFGVFNFRHELLFLFIDALQPKTTRDLDSVACCP